ncbi:MAG: alpha/beta hydrolase fold domain-containing protein [Roseibacillus sp.]
MNSFQKIRIAVIYLSFLNHSFAKEAPLEAPEGVTIQRDLDFLAAGRKEKLDLYLPQPRQEDLPSPAVVIIHGGGWVKGDKNREREFVTGTTLAQAGYVCISINYETRKDRRWPNNLHDCKNAVRWLRVNAEKLNIDPEHIGVIGGSAGGHLAMMVAYTPNHPKLSSNDLYPGISDHVNACINMYGISDLLTRKVTTEDGTPTEELKGHRLFSQSREEAPLKWRNASPVTYVNEDSPPTLTFHGTTDTTVDRDQSKELHEALREVGAESTLKLIKGANHAWPLKTKSFDHTPTMVAFFDRHLKGNPDD